MLFSHFHSVQNISKLFVISSLTHWLFRSVLFTFYICKFHKFPFIIDLYFHSIAVRKHIFYDFNCFKFIDICFKDDFMVYLEECSSATEKNMYFAIVEWNIL